MFNAHIDTPACTTDFELVVVEDVVDTANTDAEVSGSAIVSVKLIDLHSTFSLKFTVFLDFRKAEESWCI